MISNISSIISGWANYLFENEEVEKVAKERAEICNGCDFKEENKIYEKLMPDYTIEIEKGDRCGSCKCPFSTMLRSMDYECPEGYWKAEPITKNQ